MDFNAQELDRHITEYKKHQDKLFEKSISEHTSLHAQKQHVLVQRIVDNMLKLKTAMKKEQDSIV